MFVCSLHFPSTSAFMIALILTAVQQKNILLLFFSNRESSHCNGFPASKQMNQYWERVSFTSAASVMGPWGLAGRACAVPSRSAVGSLPCVRHWLDVGLDMASAKRSWTSRGRLATLPGGLTSCTCNCWVGLDTWWPGSLSSLAWYKASAPSWA